MHSWRNGRRSRLRSGRHRAGGASSTRRGMEVQVLPGAPIKRHPRAGGDPRKRLRGTVTNHNHLAWVPAFAGMTSEGRMHRKIMRRSLRQAAKASVLHTDIPRFESWSEHQSSSIGRPKSRYVDQVCSIFDAVVPMVRNQRARGAPNFGITLSANRRRLSREPWPKSRT